jgi:hypothetical protein
LTPSGTAVKSGKIPDTDNVMGNAIKAELSSDTNAAVIGSTIAVHTGCPVLALAASWSTLDIHPQPSLRRIAVRHWPYEFAVLVKLLTSTWRQPGQAARSLEVRVRRAPASPVSVSTVAASS